MGKYVLCGLIIFLGCQNSNNQKLFYDNGNIELQVPLKDGKRHGKLIQYYESGEIQLISLWKEGVKSGPIKEFHKNGILITEGSYQDNQEHGIFKEYDSLGMIKVEYTMQYGKEEGKLIEYFSDGKKSLEVSYNKGKLNGEGFVYYPNGKIHKKLVHQAGKLIYSRGIDKNGNIYDSKLPISVNSLDSFQEYNINDSINLEIELLYSDIENVGIYIILGNLNEQNHLQDTIKGWVEEGLKTTVVVTPENYKKNEITGILSELRLYDQKIFG